MNRQTCTLCIIARDEEATIGQTIKSALAVSDEIVVVDTGSADNTRLIAEGYGAKIVDAPWSDDFAAARNAGLEAAGSDWILVLDADERLQPVRPVEFRKLLSDDGVAGYRVRILAAEGAAAEPASGETLRLFRNHPHVRYCYPIHERIGIALANWGEARGLRVADSVLAVRHDPGGDGKASARHERNLRILQQALAEYPYEPYFAYRLGCATLTTDGDDALPVAGLAASAAPLARAWGIVAGMAPADAALLDYGPDLARRLAAAHTALERHAEALSVATAARAIFREDPELDLRWAAVVVRGLGGEEAPDDAFAGLADAAERILDEAAGGGEPDGAITGRRRFALCLLGELALWRGRNDAAAGFFEASLAGDEAYAPGWRGLGDCARRGGDPRRALGLYLRAVTASELDYRSWLRGSRVLTELGFNDNAASWLQKHRSGFPEHPPARAEGVPDAADVPTPETLRV